VKEARERDWREGNDRINVELTIDDERNEKVCAESDILFCLN